MATPVEDNKTARQPVHPPSLTEFKNMQRESVKMKELDALFRKTIAENGDDVCIFYERAGIPKAIVELYIQNLGSYCVFDQRTSYHMDNSDKTQHKREAVLVVNSSTKVPPKIYVSSDY